MSTPPPPGLDRLPFEILGEILEYLVSSNFGPLALGAVLFVSRTLNSAAMSHPQLWTKIKIDRWLYTYIDPGRLEAATRSYIRACLQRSALLPFDLVLNFKDVYMEHQHRDAKRFDWSKPATTQVLRILPVFREENGCHMQRCRRLYWYHNTLLPFGDAAACFPRTLKGLRFLYIQRLVDFRTRIHPAFSCPALEHVICSRHYSFQPFALANQVETLEVFNQSGWYTADLSPVCQFGNSLRLLQLRCFALATDSEYVSDGEVADEYRGYIKKPAILPNLSTLEITGRVPHGFLIYLRAPNLQHLRLIIAPHGGHSMDELRSCAVHKMARSLFVQATSSKHADWKFMYDDLVADMPYLEEAKVEGGSAEEIGAGGG
jgi:hypothetical protein